MVDLQVVNVANIRSALKDLWAQEAAGGTSVIRAHTHNLIVYTEDTPEELTRTVEKLISITLERPGRVILVHADPNDDEHLDAAITAYCRAVNHRQLCGEMITLTVGGHFRDEIHSTVISLLASSLPVYLWWNEELRPDDHLYEHLAPEATRVLINSGLYTDAPAGLSTAATLQAPGLGDLSWGALTPWRRLIAELWDMPDLRQPLQHIRSVGIHYASPAPGTHQAQALLLMGWMASRLGWHLLSMEENGVGGMITHWRSEETDTDDTKVEIVHTTRETLPNGAITGVYIQAGKEPPFVMPRLELLEDCGCIEMRRDDATPGRSAKQVPHEPVGLSAALAEELDFGYDQAYTDALQQVNEALNA